MEKLLVTRSSMPSYEEYCAEIAPLWESRWLTNAGQLHCRLQEQLQEKMGLDHVELFVNGHTALELGIRAFDLHGEVITTPYTFASSTHALTQNGLKPVFCDIKMSDFNIDEEKIEALITPNTSAILAVHVYGQPCNMEKLQKIAAKYDLKLIYDAAHAFGVTVKGVPIGNYGDLSMYSFHATKVFHTIEGGAAVYRDETMGRTLRMLRNFGLNEEDALFSSGNGKLSEFSAAMGLCNLRHLKENVEKRAAAYEMYKKGLDGIPSIRPFIYTAKDTTYNYAYYPILVDDTKFPGGRDRLKGLLEEKQIFTRKYFYPLTCDFACYRNETPPDVPVARYVSSHVLCLPMYADLTPEQVEKLCDILRRIVKREIGK